jgi:putative copper resistance protein D
MSIEAGLVASRFVHYAALTILFGLALFPVYAFATAALAAAFRKRSRTALILIALLGVASGIAWAAFTAAAMQDDIAGATDPATWAAMIVETTFGMVWLARLALLAVLTIIFASRRAFGLVECLVAAAALAAIALTGHTQMQEGSAQLIATFSDALHVLAAGTWLGGIAGLLMILAAARAGDPADEQTAATALKRFSPVGYAVVATLLATGITNSLFMLGSFSELIESPYGRVLLVKLGLFAAMLALAANNRFILTPRLDADETRRLALRIFARQVTVEQLVGLGVLAIVALLGTTEPPM